MNLRSGHTVSPLQFLGPEVNPRAAAIAEVVLWIGYLRPAYQNPEGVQAPDLGIEAGTAAKRVRKATRKLPWPKTLAERVQAVQRALGAEESPVTAPDLARRFRRAQAAQVEALLETLDALGLVRRTEDGRYGA